MNGNNEAQEVFEEVKAVSADRQRTARQVIAERPKLVRAVIQLVLAQWRPLLAFLYNASRNAQTLLADSKKKWELKSPALKPNEGIAGVIAWIQENGINVFNYLPFQMLQDASANVYAAILLLECDKLVKQIKKPMDIMDHESGPLFSGQPLTRILRAAGNQYRHGSDWPEAGALNIDDAKVLADIGIANIKSPSVQTEILAIIGGAGYFDFEDSLLASIMDLLASASEPGKSGAV